MEILQSISDALAAHSATVIPVGIVIMEIVSRLVSSTKVVSIPRQVSKALHLVASILDGSAAVLDKVIPDRQ